MYWNFVSKLFSGKVWGWEVKQDSGDHVYHRYEVVTLTLRPLPH